MSGNSKKKQDILEWLKLSDYDLGNSGRRLP